MGFILPFQVLVGTDIYGYSKDLEVFIYCNFGLLWDEYRSKKNQKALDTLLAYNLRIE
jgi:hypothetical protein